MDLSTITVADFKSRFYRDFTYANQTPDQVSPPPDIDIVQDVDITNAFADASILLNQSLFSTDESITSGYLLLTAHFLCTNIKAASGGVNSGGSGFPVVSRAVGSVSESYQIPDAYKNSPILAQYTSTAYGLRYLALVLPMLIGNVIAIQGATRP
jgi:hypothetical protein